MARRGRNTFEPIGSTYTPRMGDLTVGDYANGMPNIRLGEMFKSFIRQAPWVILLLIIGSGIAYYLTKDLKRTYSGDASIMVQLGEEYVYNPVGQASNGGGLMTTIDTITLTEAGLMQNDELIARVINRMTSGDGALTPAQAERRFAKSEYQKINAAKRNGNNRDLQDATMKLRNKVANSYYVAPRPKSSIIDVSYKHENPDVAVEAVNAFVDEYLSFRREVFVEGSSELISERRIATEEQLNSNERAIARFLKKNDVGDFVSEQTGLRERTEDLKASLNGTRASIAETEAALALVEDQLRQTPVTIDLFRDDRASQRVSQAELELGQLLAKYLPTSDPVRQKQTELKELRALQSSYGGKASGGRRVGPNPTHQALTTRRNALAATADSLREREFTQQRQLNSADAKIRRLTALTPEYENLLRERSTLESRLTSYNAKEQEALVDAQQAEARAENVKVISRAEFANKGRNTQKLAWLGATLAWGLILFFIAMIRVFLDPRLYAVPAAVRAVPEPEPLVDLSAAQAPIPEHAPIPEAVPVYNPPQPYAPNPYEAQPAAYGTPDPYAQTAYAQNYQTAYIDPNIMPQESYVGNTAVDLSQNPYASGQVEAGALNPNPPYAPTQS